jgi:phage terminase large subunit-like protein
MPLPNPENYAAMVMNPYGNMENVAPEYIAELETLPERQKQRFLLGRFTTELDNALWTADSFRHMPTLSPEDCERIVVAVDPSGASGREDVAPARAQAWSRLTPDIPRRRRPKRT